MGVCREVVLIEWRKKDQKRENKGKKKGSGVNIQSSVYWGEPRIWTKFGKTWGVVEGFTIRG